jgi:hypothetical protein
VAEQPLVLTLENASTSGVRPLSYAFEVATDVNFNNRIFERTGIAPGENGRTTLRLPDPLATGRQYYWRARAEDGANTGEYSIPVVFNIFTPVVIGRPNLRSPSGSIDNFRPRFVIGNAPRTGPAGRITYRLELARDSGFTNRVDTWNVLEQSGQTTFSPISLPGGQQFFWRVRASDGAATGPLSEVLSFRTPTPVAPTPPGNPGVSCSPLPDNPEDIVRCRRSQYGSRMSSSQILSMLRAVARDLNNAGISGGPWGILEKESGHNCGGFSCDIICAGQGTSQRQHDVLIDAENTAEPTWGSPKRWPNIRVDECHIIN